MIAVVQGFEFAQIAGELSAAAARYQPESMTQVAVDLQRLPEALGNIAAALKVTVERAGAEYPLHAQVVEVLAQCHQQMAAVAEASAEVYPAFRRLHEIDLARIEQPRTNERMWDITQQ